MAVPLKLPTKEPVECAGCLDQTTTPHRDGWHITDRKYFCRPCHLDLEADPDALLPVEKASDQEIRFAINQGIDLRTAFRRIQQFERRRRRKNR